MKPITFLYWFQVFKQHTTKWCPWCHLISCIILIWPCLQICRRQVTCLEIKSLPICNSFPKPRLANSSTAKSYHGVHGLSCDHPYHFISVHKRAVSSPGNGEGNKIKDDRDRQEATQFVVSWRVMLAFAQQHSSKAGVPCGWFPKAPFTAGLCNSGPNV